MFSRIQTCRTPLALMYATFLDQSAVTEIVSRETPLIREASATLPNCSAKSKTESFF